MVRTTPSRKRKERPPSSSPAASSPASTFASAASVSSSAATDATDRPAKKRTPNRRRTSSKPMPKPSPRPTPTAHARRAKPNANTNSSSTGGGRGGTDDVPSVGNIVRGIGAGSSNGAVSSSRASSSGQGTVPPASNNSNATSRASSSSGSNIRERHGLLGLLPTRAERRSILESRAAEARARRRVEAEQAAAAAERRARAGRGAGIVASAAEFAEREDSDDEEAEEEEGERDDERKKKGRNMTNNNHNHNEELADTSSDEEEGDGDRKKKKKASAATKSSSPPDVDVIANATAAGDEDGCSCAICFQTYPPEGLVTLPCCGVVPSSGDGAEGGGSEDNSRELSSTTRFCPTCMVTLATRTDNPQTAFVTIQRTIGTTMSMSASSSTNAANNTSTNSRTDSSGSRNTTSTNSGGGSTFGRTHCRIGECPRCHHVLTVTNVRRNAHLDPTSSFSSVAVKGAHFSPEITAEFGWSVQDLRLEKAGLGEIVRYACGSGGGIGGIGGGIGGNQGQANANGQNGNVGNGGLGRRNNANANANANANGQAQRQQQQQQQQQQRMFQDQMMENIVDIVDAGGNAAALAANANGGAGRDAGRGAGAGRGGAAGRGGGGAARRPPRAAARNAQQAGAVNGTTGRYYGLFCFLAHTPSPDYIPADMVSLSTADEIFPKLVRWDILTEIRRTKVYALREPVATTQALIRDALPSVLFDPTLNDRARENAERLQNLEVLPGLAGLNTPQDMDAAVNLALISMNCMAKALICLLRLRPHMALWVVNQGLTTFWMALGVIPGRNGPPLAKWQRAVTFVMNMAFLYFALRGVFGILREALRSLPLAIIVVSLASAVLSKRPPHRMALDFALFYAYKRTKSTLGYASYLVLHTLWGHFMPKKWTSDCPYWVYGLLLAELFAGCYLYPDMPKFSLVASTHGMIYRVADSFAKAATESADKIALAMFGGPGLPASVFVQICPFVVILFMLHQGIKRFGKKYFVVIAAVSTAVLLAGAPR